MFIDTDVLLDVLLARKEYVEASSRVVDWAEAHPGKCAVSWHGLANIHYLSHDGATTFIDELTDFCAVPGTGTADMKRALALGFADLEDAMQVSAALRFGAQIIVTRNLKDFRESPIKALSPSDPDLPIDA